VAAIEVALQGQDVHVFLEEVMNWCTFIPVVATRIATFHPLCHTAVVSSEFLRFFSGNCGVLQSEEAELSYQQTAQ